MTPPKSRVRPHVPKVDPAIPPDQDGHETCRCGLLVVAGDARHTMPDAPPAQAEHLRRYEAGEDGDER